MTQLEIFSRNLNRYISESGKTQKEVADAIDVLPATLNTWVKGKNIPRMNKIQLLADYFHINKSDLLEPTVNPPLDITALEAEIIRAYRSCGPELQAAILDMLHVPYKKESRLSEAV